MSDISNQLIKNSYNYVLQSDVSTGIVYRIGGGIPVNPIFLSGLTINSGFTYSNGTEQPGYVLITDAFGNANWGAISGSSSGDYLPLSGGTVTGSTIFTSGITTNTISATTYLNLPKDIFVTGGTYSSGTATFTNNSGETFNVTGLYTGGTDVFVTGGTYSNGTATFTNNSGGTFDVVGLTTPFTGGTVSGATNFTNGLTSNVISATTYLNLPAESPTHIKIGSMSGLFNSGTPNSPNITDMCVGNTDFGWSFGDYNFKPSVDGFGNITNIEHQYSNVGIPLPTDILAGDKIKICGLCYYSDGNREQPLNETFYVTVSYFNCETYLIGINFDVSTLIPVASYLFNENSSVCFSEEITNNITLPGCTTYLVVGMTVGNDNEIPYNYKFSYTLDTTQITSVGLNLFIRNCCDPAYSEIILNNGVAVGKSFVDIDGNCWSVVSETTSDITEDRVLSTEYDTCNLCIDANPCPQNFLVSSCCYAGDETFTASLEGIDVGSTFVDDWGFCWSVIDITPLPITNVVTIGTIYPETNCESAECTDTNTCPNLLRIVTCCRNMGEGYTTSDILGISVVKGDVFVDTFGICWSVQSDNNKGFPNLNFLSGSTIYGNNSETYCDVCVESNNCSINLFYTVQNCCNEEIEVIELPANYGIGLTLGLVHDTGMGCYKILSWSNVGTSTLTGIKVQSTSDGVDGCKLCVLEFLQGKCIGQTQCCTSYKALNEDCSITGYLCDGTWVVNQSVPFRTSVCMAQVFKPDCIFEQGCCSFLVYNPSPTTNLELTVTNCRGGEERITLPPLETSKTCSNCVSRADGPWEWVECPI